MDDLLFVVVTTLIDGLCSDYYFICGSFEIEILFINVDIYLLLYYYEYRSSRGDSLLMVNCCVDFRE